MRATFILTRFFAISAFVCGTAPLSYAAPVGATVAPAVSPVGVDSAAALIPELPLAARVEPEFALDQRDANADPSPDASSPEPPPDGEPQDVHVEGRTCFTIAICR